MSLFGGKKPVVYPVDAQIRPDAYSFAMGIIRDSGVHAINKGALIEKILELTYRLNEFMVGEIIAHLPEEHRDTYIQMNNQHRPFTEVDKFLLEHMPNAGKVFEDAYAKFRELHLRKGG